MKQGETPIEKSLPPPANSPHNAKLTQKLCPQCGYKFWAKRSTGRFCSPLCRTHACLDRAKTYKLLEVIPVNEGDTTKADNLIRQIYISKFWKAIEPYWHKKRQVALHAEYRGKRYMCAFVPFGKNRSVRMYINKADI